MLNKKIRQEHTIMKEFHDILNAIAKIEQVQRIIPGRISRKQSGSSKLFFSCSYDTTTGRKYKMSKGSTSQELFVVCTEDNKKLVKDSIAATISQFF